jgi:hypothetical protein
MAEIQIRRNHHADTVTMAELWVPKKLGFGRLTFVVGV